MSNMRDDLLKDIHGNKFLILLLEEKDYISKLSSIIKSIDGKKSKICYVCISKPYSYVLQDLKDNGIESHNFFFVDTMSSHYAAPEPTENCIFVDQPYDLPEITSAIKKAVVERGCKVIIFDTISSMLVYQKSFPIVKFTNCLVSEHDSVKKLFVMLKENIYVLDEGPSLIKDLGMFADKTLEWNNNAGEVY